MPHHKLLIITGPGSNYHAPAAHTQLTASCNTLCAALGVQASFCTALSHAEIADQLDAAAGQQQAVIVDPGANLSEQARTAIENAMATLGQHGMPMIEAHSHNIFRTNNNTQPLRPATAKLGLVCGLGSGSYRLAIEAAVGQLGGDTTVSEQTGQARKVRVINGPNLNLLGSREPEIYGYDTLNGIEQRCNELVKRKQQAQLEFLQSNYEGQIVDWIQESISKVDTLIINAGAYTHTSIAIHDALKAFNGFTVELHISNPHLRETFRHTSYLSLAADAIVAGLGAPAYEYCLQLTGSDSTAL